MKPPIKNIKPKQIKVQPALHQSLKEESIRINWDMEAVTDKVLRAGIKVCRIPIVGEVEAK